MKVTYNQENCGEQHLHMQHIHWQGSVRYTGFSDSSSDVPSKVAGLSTES